MLPIRCIMRSGFGVLRINTTSCFVRHTRRNLNHYSHHLSSLSKHRSIIEGRVPGVTVSPTVQKSTSSANQEKGDARRIADASLRNDDFIIEVQWRDGSKSKYPYIWLRDNCQCSDCFHGPSLSKRLLLQDLDISITPKSFKVDDAGDELDIDWTDGHKGCYRADWLEDRSFEEDKRAKRQQVHRFNHSFWGSDMIERLPRANFQDLLQDDYALQDFLQNLVEFGLVVVAEAPRHEGQIELLSNRVGFMKRTHYGPTFSVKQRVDAKNIAYTANYLNLHGDLAYIDYKPGVQLLHCISQATGEGGENHLVDSFHVANQLRDRHPDKYEILTQIPVDYQDRFTQDDGFQYDVISQSPMIALDRYGLIKTVNFSHMSKDSYFDISVDKVKQWYDAMLTFHKLMYHPDNLITYKMDNGDILVFDNNRVLHGRTAYKITEGSRQLEGGYIDWDMVKSRRRILAEKLALAQ